jgi:anti-sigma regulatory factor (Ser/Thr protein kinase)
VNVHLAFPCEVSSVGNARFALRNVLAEAGSTLDECDAAATVMTELLANAIVHSQRCSQPIEVAIACSDRRIHIEVLDHNAQAPAPRQIASDALSGRGLSIVDALTSDWGWNAVGDGNRVWGDVPRGFAPPGPVAANRA